MNGEPARAQHRMRGIDTRVERYSTDKGARMTLTVSAPVTSEDSKMTLSNLLGRAGRTLALTTAIVGAIGLTVTPQPAHALGTGAAVGIGLGALAVGTAVGAAAASPYAYGPGPYYGYAPAYYPPAPGYYGYGPGPAHSCWSPYYGRYYPC
jgi:hypothetical protein